MNWMGIMKEGELGIGKPKLSIDTFLTNLYFQMT